MLRKRRAAKNIGLFADGTGNSASKLFKTNVWRMYQALDLSDPPPPGQPRQVAFYHDGVGTSTFKPLAILGGVFGIGLKRNVIEIYSYLCRNYDPGDRIYAFGFSRGAFTARVLVGLVATQGIIRCETEEELKRYATDAYRRYRRRYKLPIFGYKDTTQSTDKATEEQTVGLVDVLRNLRDGVIRAWRRFRRFRQYNEVEKLEVSGIEFIGVWDSVDAYGLPIDELTRGVDEWVWPLSMPNYELSPKVKRARHALSLDEERDSFQPLLWDEVAEERLVHDGKVPASRLQQVWFAGVHSNVGGGYADDALSQVPLHWMIAEGEKAGLRYLPPECRAEELRCPPHPFGRLYDSRRGVAAYYRYQPRKLLGKLEHPDATTFMTQDPNRNGVGFLKRVQVHESVLQRIRAGDDRYAPLVLPEAFDVVNAVGTVVPHPQPSASARRTDQRQEWVWNDVWRRRVNYFMTVAVSAWLVALPMIQGARSASACVGPQCLISPVLTGLGGVLPGFVQPWIQAFARSPGLFLLGVIAIILLMIRSGSLKRNISDGSRELWAQSLSLPLGPSRPRTEAGRSTGLPDNWIYKARSGRGYQRAFQLLKWRWIPSIFGATLLAVILLVPIALVVLGVYRANLAFAERSGRICTIGSDRTGARGPSAGAETIYPTSALCWSTGLKVERNKRYRLTLVVTKPWFDASMSATPEGFGSARMPWYMRHTAALVRRSMTDRWFQPVLRIVRQNGRAHLQALDMKCACQAAAPAGSHSAEFTAAASGELSLFINDGVIGPTGLTDWFYANNSGEAIVRLEELKPDHAPEGG